MRIIVIYVFLNFRIFNADHLSVLSITDSYLLKQFSFFYVFDLVILILQLIFSPANLESPLINLYSGDYDSYFNYILFVPKGLLPIACLYYSFLTRKIDLMFNESRLIVYSIWHFFLAFFSFLVFVVSISDRVRVVDLYFAGSCTALFICFVTFMIIFYSKFLAIIYPNSFTESSGSSMSPNSKFSTQITRPSSNIANLTSRLKSESELSLRLLCESKEKVYLKRTENMNRFVMESDAIVKLIVQFRSRLEKIHSSNSIASRSESFRVETISAYTPGFSPGIEMQSRTT